MGNKNVSPLRRRRAAERHWTVVSDEQKKQAWPFKSEPPQIAWVDVHRTWAVMTWRHRLCDGTPWEGMQRVGIRHADGEIEVPWSTIQRIKDDLFPGQLAVEIYPPRDQIVDVAPCRWLFVFPVGCVLPLTISGEATTVG